MPDETKRPKPKPLPADEASSYTGGADHSLAPAEPDFPGIVTYVGGEATASRHANLVSTYVDGEEVVVFLQSCFGEGEGEGEDVDTRISLSKRTAEWLRDAIDQVLFRMSEDALDDFAIEG